MNRKQIHQEIDTIFHNVQGDRMVMSRRDRGVADLLFKHEERLRILREESNPDKIRQSSLPVSPSVSGRLPT
jgi:hypothetical protein